MALANINKWIGGETELFFDSGQKPTPVVSVDGNPGKGISTTRPAGRKFEHTAILAVVAAFASIALVCFVLAMRQPSEPSLTADVTAPPADAATTPTRALVVEDAVVPAPATPQPTEPLSPSAPPMLSESPPAPSDAQLAAFLRDVGIWYDRRTEVVPGPERKPSPPQRASRRHWPLHSVRASADRGEAARLMADELQQRGIAPVGSSMQRTRTERRLWRAMRQGESLN